jgi:hypothetical protein
MGHKFIIGGWIMADILRFNAIEVAEVLGAQNRKPHENNEFMRHLLHDSAAALLPIVEQVLAAEYKNNPIFSGVIDRESLAQLTDRVVNLAHSMGVQGDFKRALANVLVLVSLLMG